MSYAKVGTNLMVIVDCITDSKVRAYLFNYANGSTRGRRFRDWKEDEQGNLYFVIDTYKVYLNTLISMTYKQSLQIA